MSYKSFVLSSFLFCISFVTSAHALQSKNVIQEKIRKNVIKELDEYLMNYPNNKHDDIKKKIIEKAEKWAQITDKLPNDVYEDDISDWIINSLTSEAKTQGLAFVDSSENYDAFFKELQVILGNSFSKFTPSLARKLFERHANLLKESQEYDENLEKFIIDYFSKKPTVTIKFSAEHLDFLDTIAPTLKKQQKGEGALDYIGSHIIQDYMWSWLRYGINMSAASQFNSINSIASAAYNPTDARSNDIPKKFAEVLPDLSQSFNQVLSPIQNKTTIDLQRISGLVWSSYQARWQKVPLYDPDKKDNTRSVKVIVEIDQDIVEELRKEIAEDRIKRYAANSLVTTMRE